MKKIKTIQELKEKVIEVEESLPKLPYGWKIGIYGDLYKEGIAVSGGEHYQEDEAKRLVKALYNFYFPKEKKND